MDSGLVFFVFDGIYGVSRAVWGVWDIHVRAVKLVLLNNLVCECFLGESDGYVSIGVSLAVKLDAKEVPNLCFKCDLGHMFLELILECDFGFWGLGKEHEVVYI